jgi:hypothetical protein
VSGSAGVQSGDDVVTISYDKGTQAVTFTSSPPTVPFAGRPKARCAGHDGLSGVLSCTLKLHVSGHRVTVTATATDRAGNTGSARVEYTV